MLTIPSLLKSFQSLDTNKVIHDSLTEEIPTFETSQREQLKAGKTKTGEPISPRYRSRKYAEAKNAMNPLPGLGVPDLLLTGEFQRRLDLEITPDTLDIISKDEKGPELEDKYPDIFGLGTNYKREWLNTHLGPTVRGKISNFTKLSFT